MDTNKHEFFETEKEWIPAFAGMTKKEKTANYERRERTRKRISGKNRNSRTTDKHGWLRIFLKIIPGHLCLPMYRDGLLFFLLLLITDN